MKSVVIVGAGGSGREVLEIFKDQNKISVTWDILGFIDETKKTIVTPEKLIPNYIYLNNEDKIKVTEEQYNRQLIMIHGFTPNEYDYIPKKVVE